jgi:hypothetical protein
MLRSRTLLIGLLSAACAFTYALADRNGALCDRSVPESSDRAAGSNLLFANPFVDPTLTASVDRDLGDATPGSVFPVRRINAKYGVLPYSFTAGTLVAFSNNSLLLETTGLLHTGVAGSSFVALPSSLPVPFRFLCSVVDSSGTQIPKTEPFFLNLLMNQNQFRIGIGPRLSDAVRYQPYIDSIPVINGTPGYSFSILALSASGGGRNNLSSLEPLGLTMTGDGIVYGQPLVAGPIVFTVVCKDRSGNTARSRDGTTFNQKLTINVDDNPVIQTSLYVTSMKISGNSSKTGADKLSMSGLLNLNGIAVSKVAGNVTVRIGSYLSPTATIGAAPGKATNAVSGPGKKPPTLNFSVSSKGLFKVQISHETFSDMNTLVAGGPGSPTAVELTVGGQIDAMQCIQVAGKTSNNKFSGSFKPGGGKGGNNVLAGAFLLLSASGKDVNTASTIGAPFDAWKVSFIAVPAGANTFGGSIKAAVSVGSNFQDTEAVTAAKGGVKLAAKADPKATNKITSLNMSLKGKGSYTTSPLNGNFTGIPASQGSTGAMPYATSILLSNGASTVFGGAGSIVIFPGAKTWTSTNPTK